MSRRADVLLTILRAAGSAELRPTTFDKRVARALTEVKEAQVSARGASPQVPEGERANPPCPRCYCQEKDVWPWVGFRIARVVWWCGLAVIVLLAPILASDILVMTPLTVMFLFAGGPLLWLAKEQPTCRVCGLARPSPGWHETPCRPLRAVTKTALRARVPSVPPTEPPEESGVRPLPRRPI